MDKAKQIISILKEKGELKQKVFDKTLEVFNNFKQILSEIEKEYNLKLQNADSRVKLEYRNNGIFQCELKVAGDLLVFYMHSNIFEFDREHKIWSMPIAKQDKNSTYSGSICIYNFLADSFKFSRFEDLGYLIGRIFINKDKFFFVEGKQQTGYLTSNFGTHKINKEIIKEIIESAILYSLKFDLLAPPYDNVKIINVEQIIETRRQGLQTGKRLGFSFNSDDISGEKLLYSGG